MRDLRLLTALAFLPLLFAQPAAEFEVATIRPTQTCAGGSPTVASPGVLTIPCYSLKNLVELAYGRFANGRTNPPWAVPNVEGGASWVSSAFYDLTAKGDREATRAVMSGPMLQKLLEDRFKLKVHRETRQAPVYGLTVLKGGPKLKVFKEGSCIPADYEGNGGIAASPNKERCVSRTGGVFGASTKTLEAQGADIKLICYLLGAYLGRPVIDQTGLKGRFDVHLEYAADDLALKSTVGNDGATRPTANAPSIFAAVQALGLKLESSKGPVDVIVIDSAQRPTEN